MNVGLSGRHLVSCEGAVGIDGLQGGGGKSGWRPRGPSGLRGGTAPAGETKNTTPASPTDEVQSADRRREGASNGYPARPLPGAHGQRSSGGAGRTACVRERSVETDRSGTAAPPWSEGLAPGGWNARTFECQSGAAETRGGGQE